MTSTGDRNGSETTFVLVRNVHIPVAQIEEYEARYEAELVPDSEWRIIQALDVAYNTHRLSNGKPPKKVTITDIDPFVEFIPHVLQVQEPVTKQMIQVPHKPAWFRRKRSFVITR